MSRPKRRPPQTCTRCPKTGCFHAHLCDRESDCRARTGSAPVVTTAVASSGGYGPAFSALDHRPAARHCACATGTGEWLRSRRGRRRRRHAVRGSERLFRRRIPRPSRCSACGRALRVGGRLPVRTRHACGTCGHRAPWARSCARCPCARCRCATGAAQLSGQPARTPPRDQHRRGGAKRQRRASPFSRGALRTPWDARLMPRACATSRPFCVRSSRTLPSGSASRSTAPPCRLPGAASSPSPTAPPSPRDCPLPPPRRRMTDGSMQRCSTAYPCPRFCAMPPSSTAGHTGRLAA